MTRRLLSLGLIAACAMTISTAARADNEGVSFEGNILWNNNGGGAQYDQIAGGTVPQTTEDFVSSNFFHNRIVDPLLDPSYNDISGGFLDGPWRPLAGSPALLSNGAPVAKVSDVDPFFVDVPYQGALSDDPGSDWTQGWTYTNLSAGAGRTDIDPLKPVVNVTTDVAANTTWTSANNYVLNGRIGVLPGATLTIQPGTAIFGSAAISYLVIERGAQIDAQGTAAAPIIFTSGSAPGSQTPGDWGGIVIHGRAIANCAAGGVVAGCNLTTTGNDCTSEGGAGFFGGSDDADNSGILRYCRSEYAGRQISLNNELNAWTFNAVGSGTTVEYLQAHRGTDDSFEWFGGTMRSSHFVGTGGDDDGLDWQMGFRGLHQFAVIVATAADNANGDKGMECDNNEFDFACPGESNGRVANVTLIGEPTLTTNGIHFRRGTNGGIFNSIIVDWKNAGFRMQHNETFDNGVGVRPPLQSPATPVVGPITNAAFRVAFGPNPVSARSVFAFNLAYPEQVEIRVFNLRGRLVESVYDGQLGAGTHTIGWIPNHQAAGIYLYQVRAGSKVASGKVMVSR